ncbi:hypothetical protein AB0C02_32315 [Micromonospora sp. NPDC048999]|uniref:hypothetical protein n=1 Tax=Micromonospora sp. NPDC048999 TaxID=3155391 RepID=UPI0033F95F46
MTWVALATVANGAAPPVSRPDLVEAVGAAETMVAGWVDLPLWKVHGRLSTMERELDPQEAAARLDLVTSTRLQLADRLITPWWYHPVLGLMAAGVIAAPATGSLAFWYASVVLFIVGCGGLARAYRTMTGVWVSGINAGPASRWAWALVLVLLVAGGLSALAAIVLNVWPASIAVAVLQIPLTVLLGGRFDEALRRRLRENR